VDAVPVAVADTVGAGDAFGAGLLAWLHHAGRLDRQALRRLAASEVLAMVTHATRVAAITCSRPGADPPWRHELPGEP
jgi:fructokinase